MTLNCGATFVKYLLCFFNFLLFGLGGALLAVSIWVAVDIDSFFLLTRITDNNNLHLYNETTVLETGAYILIAAGGIIFLLGFLGCCGAAMESRPLLVTYGVLVIFVFLLEVTAGVLIAVYKHEVEDHLEDFLKVALREHYTHQNEPNSVSVTWDAIMIQMQCCGVNNFTDFELATRWQQGNESSENVVPRACCMLQMGDQELQDGVSVRGSGPGAYSLLDESCLYNPTENNSYHLIGCHGRLRAWAESNADCLLGVAGGVGALELVVIFLAFCLCAYSGEKTKWQCDDPEDQQHLHPTLEEEGGEEDEDGADVPSQKGGDAPKNAKAPTSTNSSKSDANPKTNDTTAVNREKEPPKKDAPKGETNPTENPPKDKNPASKEQNPHPPKENSNKPDSNSKDDPKIHSKAEFDDFDDIDKVED